MTPGMVALRDLLAYEELSGWPIRYYGTTLGYSDAREMAESLLASDGPLFPALRALGELAVDGSPCNATHRQLLDSLDGLGIYGSLAEACLAANEAET